MAKIGPGHYHATTESIRGEGVLRKCLTTRNLLNVVWVVPLARPNDNVRECDFYFNTPELARRVLGAFVVIWHVTHDVLSVNLAGSIGDGTISRLPTVPSGLVALL